MLLLSRYSIQGKSEPNGYNTLDSCTDGTAGFFHSDESVDSIKVISGGGEDMKVGENIKVIAKVWVYSTSVLCYLQIGTSRNGRLQTLRSGRSSC
jgi:hypothetical protein